MSVITPCLLISLCHERGGGCLPCRDGVCIDQAKVGHVCVCVCVCELDGGGVTPWIKA